MTTRWVGAALRWALPVLTLAWAVFLFWVSTSTRGAETAIGASPDSFDWLVPPAAHLGGYGVLAGLLVLSLWAWAAHSRLWAPLAVSFVVSALYGGALELYQSTLANRSGTWGDAALNATGAAAALAALTALRWWRGSPALR